MSITVTTTRITHNYLMNKSKHDLARLVLDYADENARLHAENERAMKATKEVIDCLKRNSHDNCYCKACVDARVTLNKLDA